MSQKSNQAVLALDIGEKRIGVAATDGIVRIARPLLALAVDGTEIARITAIAEEEKAGTIVIGYPRNQSGEPTAQTAFVEAFKERLGRATALPLVFQDESLTSVLAEEHLSSHGKPYAKGDIDAMAAALILDDYLEERSGRV